MRSRRTKPYALTSHKEIWVSNIPHYSYDNNYMFISEVKSRRKDRILERRYEKKRTRQHAKQLIEEHLNQN